MPAAARAGSVGVRLQLVLRRKAQDGGKTIVEGARLVLGERTPLQPRDGAREYVRFQPVGRRELFLLQFFEKAQGIGGLGRRLLGGRLLETAHLCGLRCGAVGRFGKFFAETLVDAFRTVSALSAGGLLGEGFSFVGFLPPQSKARKTAIARWASRHEPFVFYEAPHRIVDMLRDLAAALDPERRIVVARELTKRFETIVSLTAGELPAWLDDHEPRGEYVILVDEAPHREEGLTERDRRWLDVLRELLPASKLAAAAAKATGNDRSALYDLLTKK